MTKEQYREAIARLGLTQVAAGEFLIGNPRTSRRWAAGHSPVPRSVAMLLRLMIKHELSAEDVTKSMLFPL
jgi:hypothetical protein